MSVDLGDELGHEPRLPDPGRADHRHQPALTPSALRRQLVSQKRRARASCPTSGVSQPAGERGGTGDRTPAHAMPRPAAPCPSPPPARRGSSRDGVADEPLRRLADQNLAGRGRLLQPLRGVDRVAGGERRRASPVDHLAGVDRRSGSASRAPARARARRSAAPRPRISSAARTARSASSSCARGRPKTAITASPMNFSTVPPWRSTAVRISSYHRPGARAAARGRGARRAWSSRPGRRRGR